MNDELLMRAAREYGTPSYVFDLDAFKERIETVSGYFRGRAEICYAMKARSEGQSFPDRGRLRTVRRL